MDGRVAATWELKQQRGGIEITVEPFEGLDGEVRRQLEDQVHKLGRFLQTPAILSVAAL